MKKIILSIYPEHIENIIKGTKKYEYRKRVAKKEIDTILIYSTNPIKKVIGEVSVIGILKEKPDVLWKKTKNESGITKDYFYKYFQGKEMAYAYILGEVKLFKKAKELSFYGIKSAPQSYIYLNINKYKC